MTLEVGRKYILKSKSYRFLSGNKIYQNSILEVQETSENMIKVRDLDTDEIYFSYCIDKFLRSFEFYDDFEVYDQSDWLKEYM